MSFMEIHYQILLKNVGWVLRHINKRISIFLKCVYKQYNSNKNPNGCSHLTGKPIPKCIWQKYGQNRQENVFKLLAQNSCDK